LKKTAKKKNELYLLYEDAHIKAILKRFAEEELSHVEIFNILYMFKLKNEK
jgi:rubrerythrin